MVQPKPPEPASEPAAPERCVFGVPGFSEMTVPVFASESDLDVFIAALPSGNTEDLVAIRRSKGALVVQPGELCRALDTELLGSARRLVVLSGPHKDKVGWAVKEWTRPSAARR